MKIQTILATFIVSALTAASPCAGADDALAIRFDEHLIQGNYTYPYGIAAADLDGDGDIDLTSADAAGNDALYWFENDGQGGFKRYFVQRDDPQRLERHAIGDVDGDGHLDVVIVKNLHGDLLWFRNSGHPADGKLWQRHVVTKGQLPGAYDVALADLDGDGDLDVAASSWRYGKQFAWFENDGSPADGEWKKHLIEADIPETRMMRAADLDGDGDIDLVGTGTSASLLVWYENSGRPATAAMKRHIIDDRTPKPAHGQIIDMDGDGDQDVVLAIGKGKDKDGERKDNHVAWYANPGAAAIREVSRWEKHTIDAWLPGAFEAAAGDLDGDGDIDVVATAWHRPGQVVWYENQVEPHGQWKKRILKDKWERANQVLLADLDGDDRLDIVACAEHGSYELRWWRNVSATSSRGQEATSLVPTSVEATSTAHHLEQAIEQPVPAPLQLESRLELFVDRYLIEKLDGLRLQLHRPRRAGVAIKFDKPWEGIASGHVTVILDRGKYRMYYRGWPYKPELRDGSAPGQAKHVTCYAESDDGIDWVKPNLGIHEVHGTLHNNVVLTEPQEATGRFSPFLDTRPGVRADQRYKAISTGTGKSGEYGLVVYASADGIHWQQISEEPIMTGSAFDSQNTIFWSDSEQSYVCYYRTRKYSPSEDGSPGQYIRLKDGTWKRYSTWSRMKNKPEAEEGRYDRYRWITRMTSPDLVNWSSPAEMDFGDASPEHLYTNQTEPYFRAPHIYIGTAARYLPGRWALTAEQEKEAEIHSPLNYYGIKGGSISDAVLLTSRGGNRYQRTFKEALVRPGSNLRDWTGRSNYPARGVVPTGPREMSMYVNRNYGQPSHWLERLTFRIDGIASVHAPYYGGEMITRPLVFRGTELVINFATSAVGGVRVEIQDESGTPEKGFALADCREIIGDSIQRVVTWNGGSDVSRLAGKPLRLRFVISDADLFSLRFRE